MTTPTNRPTDDELEARLRASYERAVIRAGDDLVGSDLVSASLTAGWRPPRRRFSAGAMAGVATVLVLGVVVILGVGTRPTPAVVTPSASGSPAPSEAANPSYEGIPILDEGITFPPSIDGQPVLPVGPAVDAHIASASDAAPFLVSGWYLPTERRSCNFDPGSPAPDGIYFKDCAAFVLSATPDGGATLPVFYAFAPGRYIPVDALYTQVQRVLIRVHVHDAGCSADDCAHKAVLDATLMLGIPHFGSAILAATIPPSGIPVAEAIAAGMAIAKQDLHTEAVQLLSVTAGPYNLVARSPERADGLRWVWAVDVVTTDGLMYQTEYVDYVTGEITHGQGGTVGPVGPNR